MIERWKPVPGYDNYFASNKGRIKNGDMICHQVHGKEYLKIRIFGKDMGSHIIIALAWHKNYDNKPFINHKDGKKKNNVPRNLEWCTQSENQQHSLYVLNNSNGNPKRAVRIYKDGILVKETRSVSHAATFVGGAKTNVSKVCKGERKQHKGYTFEYK